MRDEYPHTNSTADRRERWDRNARENRDCSHCPPHKGENCTPRARHGHRKPRRKDHGR